MAYAVNSLGRSTGRKFNMAAVKREIEARRIAKENKCQQIMKAREAKIAYELENPVNIFGR